MKNSLLTLSFFLMAITQLMAGDMETFIKGEASHGGFGGPVFQVGEVAGNSAFWFGGRGAWQMTLEDGNAFSIGGGGFGLTSNHIAPNADFDNMNEDEEYYGNAGYGGFIMEYSHSSYSLLHFNISSLFGAGSLMLRDKNFTEFDASNEVFMVIEPTIHAEVNITTFFRLALGVNYRFTNGVDYAGFSDSDFSGANGLLTLKFGYFP